MEFVEYMYPWFTVDQSQFEFEPDLPYLMPARFQLLMAQYPSYHRPIKFTPLAKVQCGLVLVLPSLGRRRLAGGNYLDYINQRFILLQGSLLFLQILKQPEQSINQSINQPKCIQSIIYKLIKYKSIKYQSIII